MSQISGRKLKNAKGRVVQALIKIGDIDALFAEEDDMLKGRIKSAMSELNLALEAIK